MLEFIIEGPVPDDGPTEEISVADAAALAKKTNAGNREGWETWLKNIKTALGEEKKDNPL